MDTGGTAATAVPPAAAQPANAGASDSDSEEEDDEVAAAAEVEAVDGPVRLLTEMGFAVVAARQALVGPAPCLAASLPALLHASLPPRLAFPPLKKNPRTHTQEKARSTTMCMRVRVVFQASSGGVGKPSILAIHGPNCDQDGQLLDLLREGGFLPEIVGYLNPPQGQLWAVKHHRPRTSGRRATNALHRLVESILKL